MTRNVIAVVLLCAACCAAGYVRGFGIAETRGRALLAEQAEASASEREALAVAMAEAERLARQRLEAEAERAAAIAGELSETRNRLAAERQAFTRRMDRVAEEASRHCAGLPAGWVRLYNEALGLAPAAPEAPAPVAAPASEGNAGIAGSADPNSGYIGEDAAKTTALTRAGLAESDVEAIRVRLDYDDGRAEYDVEFWLRTDTGAAEYDYEIDALTGEVLAFDYDAEDYDAAQAAQTPPAASGAAITAEEAKQIALEHAGVNEADIRALELETDRDDGRTVYEFSWKVGWTEYDYDIDAATGEILSFSQDVDD